MTGTIRLASRPSRLAMVQANMARKRLLRAIPDVQIEIVAIRSEGDLRNHEPLRAFGDKGAFVAAIEAAVFHDEADVAVHSLKDVPGELPPRLWMPCCLTREDPRDVLISRMGESIEDLPSGASVGTSSPRRVAQLRSLRRDLAFVDIRGNVDTRIQKLDEGDYDAIVLAAAGVIRLGLGGRVTEFLEPDICTPAPGQGIVALECRENYEFGEELIAAGDRSATWAGGIERSLSRQLGASCTTPFGALATLDGDLFTLRAFLATDEGEVRRATKQVPQNEAAAVVQETANLLRG